MVGWGFAFGRGVVILLWTIVWAIVAGIIAVLITGGTLAAVIRDPTAVASNPIGILAAFSLGIFLAVFIATIGVYEHREGDGGWCAFTDGEIRTSAERVLLDRVPTN